MYENKLANGEIRTEMETLTVADTSPYLNKKNSPVRVPVALNVSGKGVFKGYKLTQGGEWAGASRPSPTCVKSAVFWRS